MISFFFEADNEDETFPAETGSSGEYDPRIGFFDIEQDPQVITQEQTNTYLNEVVMTEENDRPRYTPAPVISPIFGILSDGETINIQPEINQTPVNQERNGYLDTVFSPHFRTGIESAKLQRLETSPNIISELPPTVAEPAQIITQAPVADEYSDNQPGSPVIQPTLPLEQTQYSQTAAWGSPLVNQPYNWPTSVIPQSNVGSNTEPAIPYQSQKTPHPADQAENYPDYPLQSSVFDTPIEEITPASPQPEIVSDFGSQDIYQQTSTDLFGETLQQPLTAEIANNETPATRRLSRRKRQEAPAADSLFEDFEANFATLELAKMIDEERGIDELTFNKFRLFDDGE